MSNQRTPQVTLVGNLGGDPETKTLKGRTFPRERYDLIIDEVVVEDVTSQDREIRVASLAVRGEDENGVEITRWLRLVDFLDHLKLFRKGDWIEVRGYFRQRNYLKDGEKKTIREFIVTFSKPLALKNREVLDQADGYEEDVEIPF